MPSIFPEYDAGGVNVREADGTPANPVDVQLAYSPAPVYVSTCKITALPSNCDARIEPSQINAIVSELLCFAEGLDPNGPWNCASLCNLRSAFNAWKASLDIKAFVIISDTPPTAAQSKAGVFWWESDTGNLYIYYEDGSSKQWVQIGGTGGKKAVMDGVSIVGSGQQGDPHKVGLVDCGAY